MQGQVLIVDAVATHRIIMRVKLAAAFFETRQAETGAAALSELSRPGLALAIIDARLPDMDGIEVIRRARARPGLGHLPLVLMTAGHDPVLRLAALRAGADEVLERPLDETLLVARIRSLVRASDSLEELRLRDGSARALGMAEPAQIFEQPAHIAVLAAHATATAPLADLLHKSIPHRVTRHAIPGLLQDLSRGPTPDLALIMMDASHGDNAVQAIASLRARPEYRAMAILALLPVPSRAMAAEALDRGADDAFCGPFDPEELVLRVDRLIRRKRRADRLRDRVQDGLRAAITDPLTGLHNRRYAIPRLAEMARTLRPGPLGLAVMIADIDHFKRVNDSHGHAVGDAVLTKVAQRLRAGLGPQDLLARIGGEEFLIATTGRTPGEMQALARRLCATVGTTPLQLCGGAEGLRVTVSIGLAVATHASLPVVPETLLAQADRALYHSKMLGRNKVTLDLPAA